MTAGDDDLDRWLDALSQDDAWRRPEAFFERAALADRLDLLLPAETSDPVYARAAPLMAAMDACDARLFAVLRQAIREGRGAEALKDWFGEGDVRGSHYDACDALVAGVLSIPEPVADDPVPPPGMVFYQPTPARHIVDCVRRAGITAADTVLDLGAGLGHVPLLVNVLTGASTRGVEREPAYVTSAVQAAAALGLRDVAFCCGDARDVSFDGVDVVYLFTPFIGAVLADVMTRLAQAATRQPLRIATLGPCTRTFARQPWLRADGPVHDDRVAVFHAVSGSVHR